MSAAEILAELPRLSPGERDLLASRLRELREREDMIFLDAAAGELFRAMDQAEEGHAPVSAQ
ncbi:MAG TPA: hypothetical protein PKE47_06510 [Verrucomicrobiota bacterium]|nr:hypothetical protein [Verrucomicrobiota bacterium]